jgi:hypothetical protein
MDDPQDCQARRREKMAEKIDRRTAKIRALLELLTI